MCSLRDRRARPGFAQWLRYPTDGVPRKADGKPDLTAPAPRLPDGKPDLSGIWHAAQPRQCVNGAGDSVPCGIEIGGSPLGGNLGRNLPGRHAAVSAVGGQALRRSAMRR